MTVTAPNNPAVSDYKPTVYNPRRIAEPALARLGKSMAKFGDLGGVVVNTRTGNYIAGHQRLKHLPPDTRIEITDTLKAPNVQGTVARGFLTYQGERWAVRLVDVDEQTERAMNVAANAHGGEFDDAALFAILKDLKRSGHDLDVVGFTDEQLAAMHTALNPSAEESHAGKLSLSFGVPPFTVLSTRNGWWQERKKGWIALGIESEIGRGENLTGMSARARVSGPKTKARKQRAQK